MQPDIDALHNHITTLHITTGTQIDCHINMGMPHKSPISHSLQERLKRCCFALICDTVAFNIYVLVTTLLGNHIKVLHNKSFLVCANKYMYNESVGEGN